MKDSPRPIAGGPGDLIARDDERLFEFVDTLRLSIKARVAAEQPRGLALSEVVAQVREMTRLAEQDAQAPKPFSSAGFRAIERQAIAWCIEAYQPAVFIEEQRLLAALNEPPLPPAPGPARLSSDRFPTQSSP